MKRVVEQHAQFGHHLKDIIFAANDGIVTTFAVVAGVVGAGLDPVVILIIGMANLLADGFSMATGNYLGTKSEQDLYLKEEALEREEIDQKPEEEKQEIREILIKKGYKSSELEAMVNGVVSNKNMWTDMMMHEEVGLFSPDFQSAFRSGAYTFVSFVVAGSLPLIPYFIFENGSFTLAVTMAGVALFVIGAFRKFFSTRNWFLLGLEMLLVGGLASAIAYIIGTVLKNIFLI